MFGPSARRVRALAGVALAAAAIVAGALAGTGQAAYTNFGITYDAKEAFVVSGYAQGNASYVGTATANVRVQVRLLKNGAQVGTIRQATIFRGQSVNSSIYASKTCNGSLPGGTYVTQARIINDDTGVIYNWDNSAGRNLGCN